MPQTFFVAPTGPRVGLTSICFGLVQALDQLGINAGFAKPIAQTVPDQVGSDQVGAPTGADASFRLAEVVFGADPVEPITMAHVLARVDQGLEDQLLEDVIHRVQLASRTYDVVIVEGLTPEVDDTLIDDLNPKIALALDADVILVAAPAESSSDGDSDESNRDRLSKRIRRHAALYGGTDHERVLGSVVNKVGTPSQGAKPLQVLSDLKPLDPVSLAHSVVAASNMEVFSAEFRCLGVVPWEPKLSSPRLVDIQRFLDADVLNRGELESRRATSVTLCARQVENMVHLLVPGALVVTPGDRNDIFLAATVATMNGVRLGGVILTGGITPENSVLELGEQALNFGLPVLVTEYNSYRTIQYLDSMNMSVPADDTDRIRRTMASVANRLDVDWLSERAELSKEARMSPAAFRYSLVERARRQVSRIVLPEGAEPRTVEAAIRCHEKSIAECVLLAPVDEVARVAAAQGFRLPAELTCIDPLTIVDSYVGQMVKLREHKGLTAPAARAQLDDPVVLGTMMLAVEDVDGLVSGAVNTTANTVRPAFQLIKTKPGTELVSSIFFMGLPEQVVVYGDCAINPDPNTEELADIAIQSAVSAEAFGIEPRVAMISYSTGASGSGHEVDKVRAATELVKEKRPDLIVDGPLQYDAAAVESVGKSKAPGSPVAGRATVFVFPDLNTGNTTYKAVQRSANVISIGPMLQGLNKPVNDLSRGALVDDIIYTIALTAVQSQPDIGGVSL